MSLIDELAIEFGIGRHDLSYLIATAPRRYKSYEIAKRRGGVRVIAQPSRELKVLQRYLLTEKLEKLPVHRAATAYVKGIGIRDNAYAHRGSHALLKLDFASFFPSIRPRDFTRYVLNRRPDAILIPDLPLYESLLFWGEGRRAPRSLSIGAPTSPIISNILLWNLDDALSRAAQRIGVVYTRYADDITVSGASAEDVLNFERACRSQVSKMKSPKLTFNDEKRGLYLQGQKQMVTGLNLTPEGAVSIGRNRKREISALLHRVTIGNLDAERTGRLKGLLGFTIACEPDFVTRMRSKYGDSTVDLVLHFTIPPRSQRLSGRDK